MKRLLLARHAKSSWRDRSLRDHDRPLNGRGRRAAPRVGAKLEELGCAPERVYSSTSARTRETWALMEPHFRGRPVVEFSRELYLASPKALLDAAAAAPPEAGAIMLLGHNPSTHAVAAYLARSGDPEEIERLRHAFPTGAVAVVELSGSAWSDVEQGGALAHFLLPRKLG